MSYGIRHLYSPVWAPHSCVFYKQQALRECLSDWRNLQSRYPTPVLGPAAHPGPRPDWASFSCRHPGRNSGWGGAGQAWVQGHIRFISIPTHFWLLPGAHVEGASVTGCQAQGYQCPLQPGSQQRSNCQDSGLTSHVILGTMTSPLCASVSPLSTSQCCGEDLS